LYNSCIQGGLIVVFIRPKLMKSENLGLGAIIEINFNYTFSRNASRTDEYRIAKFA